MRTNRLGMRLCVEEYKNGKYSWLNASYLMEKETNNDLDLRKKFSLYTRWECLLSKWYVYYSKSTFFMTCLLVKKSTFSCDMFITSYDSAEKYFKVSNFRVRSRGITNSDSVGAAYQTKPCVPIQWWWQTKGFDKLPVRSLFGVDSNLWLLSINISHEYASVREPQTSR